MFLVYHVFAYLSLGFINDKTICGQELRYVIEFVLEVLLLHLSWSTWHLVCQIISITFDFPTFLHSWPKRLSLFLCDSSMHFSSSLTVYSSLFVYSINSICPNTEPCGTPCVTDVSLKVFWILSHIVTCGSGNLQTTWLLLPRSHIVLTSTLRYQTAPSQKRQLVNCHCVHDLLNISVYCAQYWYVWYCQFSTNPMKSNFF